jgi:hypothetical protein
MTISVHVSHARTICPLEPCYGAWCEWASGDVCPDPDSTKGIAVLQKVDHHNVPYSGPAPEGTHALEREGHYLLRGAFTEREIAELRHDILRVYRRVRPDLRACRPSRENAAMFRYEMFNRSALVQRAIGVSCIMDILEPLLGADSHVISCTAWKNGPGRATGMAGLAWHVDGGPHVPRSSDCAWPSHVPYPIFVVATHVYLDDVSLEDGPTAIVPGSHTSGRLPPPDRLQDPDLTYGDRGMAVQIARAGDVGFFVSDVWHRRLPPSERSRGRFFLQTNYGRREIAQRVRSSSVVNHASRAAIKRARTKRDRQLIGLHPEWFYDG